MHWTASDVEWREKEKIELKSYDSSASFCLSFIISCSLWLSFFASQSRKYANDVATEPHSQRKLHNTFQVWIRKNNVYLKWLPMSRYVPFHIFLKLSVIFLFLCSRPSTQLHWTEIQTTSARLILWSFFSLLFCIMPCVPSLHLLYMTLSEKFLVFRMYTCFFVFAVWLRTLHNFFVYTIFHVLKQRKKIQRKKYRKVERERGGENGGWGVWVTQRIIFDCDFSEGDTYNEITGSQQWNSQFQNCCHTHPSLSIKFFSWRCLFKCQIHKTCFDTGYCLLHLYDTHSTHSLSDAC